MSEGSCAIPPRYAQPQSGVTVDPNANNVAYRRGATMGLIPSHLPAAKAIVVPPSLQYCPTPQSQVQYEPTCDSRAPIQSQMTQYAASPPTQMKVAHHYHSERSLSLKHHPETQEVKLPNYPGTGLPGDENVFGEDFVPLEIGRTVRNLDPLNPENHRVRRVDLLITTSLKDIANGAPSARIVINPSVFNKKGEVGNPERAHVVQRIIERYQNPFSRHISATWAGEQGSHRFADGSRASLLMLPNDTRNFAEDDRHAVLKVKRDFITGNVAEHFKRLSNREDLLHGIRPTLNSKGVYVPLKTEKFGENQLIRMLKTNYQGWGLSNIEQSPIHYDDNGQGHYIIGNVLVNWLSNVIDERVFQQRKYTSLGDYGVVLGNPQPEYPLDDVAFLTRSTSGFKDVAEHDVSMLGTITISVVETVVFEEVYDKKC